MSAWRHRLGIAARLFLPGHVATIDPYLAQADVFVLSSDYEGLPGVVVEALAAGLPVLATDCCASMACLLDRERGSLLVPRGDVEAFAEGLSRLRKRTGDPASSRKIAARYEIEAAASRYIEMMKAIRGNARVARQ